jgi:hypothetical protein
MICASVVHKKNGEQYQQWDVPVGQDTTTVNVDHVLSTLTGDILRGHR